MRGTIDGIEVYLDEDQLPAFTLSVNSLTDPSKVQGVRSTTIRIVATPEARRVLGTEYMAQVKRGGARPVLRIGDGDVDLFRAEVVPVKWTRDVIECLAIGGNASWFEYAKSVKLRDFDFGLGPASTEVAIQNTWTFGAYNDLYYPLVDYGSLEGRDDTYNVTASKFRPAIGVFHTMERLFALQGFELWPDASVANSLLKMVALTPGKALVRRTQGDPATRVVYSENPSIQYAITVVGSTPNVLTGLDTAPTFGAAQWDNVNYAYTPASDGRLVLMIANGFCRLYINPSYTTYIGRQIRMSLWDFTDGVEVAGVWSDKLTSLGFIDFGMEIGPKYVLAGHKIGIAWQVDGPVSDTNIEVIGFTCTYAPESEWVTGERPYINSLMPDMTLGELLTTVITLLDCVVLTNGKRITIKTWDAYMRSRIISGARDWSNRMDHSAAPDREYNAPAGVSFTFAKDNGDREVGRLDRVLGGEGFANARAVFDGVGNEVAVSVKVSPTAMGECLGGCLIPLLRKDGGELDTDGVHYVDNFDRSTRMLMVDGMKAGTWTFGTTAKTSYPNCYFLRPDQRTQALHFANADIFSGPEVPGSTSTSWQGRLRMIGSGDTLTAYFHLRDNELQDFDFGMPTLVDDGSGPAWYWVQEIRDHRFGAGLPTKVTLVKIPDVEYQPPANPPVVFPEPPQPFVCEGPGTASIVVAPGGGTKLFVSQGTSTHFTVRGPSQTFTWPINAPDGIDIGEGSWCIYASDADGNPGGSIYDLQIGMFTENDIMSVDLSRMNDLRDVYMIEIETAATFAPFNADLENISISGAALISVLPSFGNVDGLQSFSIDNMAVLSALPDFSPDALATFFIQSCQSLASIGTLPMINQLDIADTGITDPAVVDALVNALHPASGGIATFNGLLSLRTSASDTNYNACISAGWTII